MRRKGSGTGRVIGTCHARRWLIIALLVVTAFIAAPSFAAANGGSGTPTLSSDQPSYMPGSAVDLSGTGFVAGDTVTVTMSDAVSGWTSDPVAVTVAGDGTFSGALITLPSTFSATLTATATDTTNGDTASVDVMETMPAPSFTPIITTDQSDYAPGSVVTITGSGWPAGDTVSVVTNDAVSGSFSQTDQVTTDASGSFTDQVTLPLMHISNYLVTASDRLD